MAYGAGGRVRDMDATFENEETAMRQRALITAFGGKEPEVDEAAFVSPTSVLIGEVTLGAAASVWYGAVLRADCGPIVIGASSNIQDNCTLHVDPGFPVTIGERVSVGHNAVVHGATVEDDCLIGMGATVLNGARIGANCLIGAGALVTEGKEIPDNSLVVGAPGKVVRELDAQAIEGLRRSAKGYIDTARRFARGLTLLPDYGRDFDPA